MYALLANNLKEIRKNSINSANRKRSKGLALKKGGIVYLHRTNIKTKRPSDKLNYTKLGPFKIKEKLGPVTYELELPKEITIYPVFHLSLLETAVENVKLLGPVDINKETQELRYEVKAILGNKLINDVQHYLIH